MNHPDLRIKAQTDRNIHLYAQVSRLEGSGRFWRFWRFWRQDQESAGADLMEAICLSSSSRSSRVSGGWVRLRAGTLCSCGAAGGS